MNIGVTVARGSPRVEKDDRQSNIDLEAINPVNGRKGALAAAEETFPSKWAAAVTGRCPNGWRSLSRAPLAGRRGI